MKKINNIIFDIGNVIVKWQPFEIIKENFPNTDPKEFFKKMYPVWKELNLGRISIKEALSIYTGELQIDEDKIVHLIEQLKLHQTILPGSIELLAKLKAKNYRLFSITDNIKEFVEYHKKNSVFFPFFEDVIVSADLGILKPDIKIFQHLLDKHKLTPESCLFLDDLQINIDGAKEAGINAIIFTDAENCEKELIRLGVL